VALGPPAGEGANRLFRPWSGEGEWLGRQYPARRLLRERRDADVRRPRGSGQWGGAGGWRGLGRRDAGGASGTRGAPSAPCTFTVDHAESSAIGTVEIVTFTVGLPNLTEAHVDFGPAGARRRRPRRSISRISHRTLLLGMKAEKPYTFRIAATDGATVCTSGDFSFTTGALPSNAPAITEPLAGAAAPRDSS
jgi:hypothetical protein